MATELPNGVVIVDGGDPPGTQGLAYGSSVDSLIGGFTETRQLQTFSWVNAAARNAQTGMLPGDFGYQIDTQATYQYDGANWVKVLATLSTGRQPTNTVTDTGTNDLDAGLLFDATPFDTVIELEALVVFDLTGTPPSSRTASLGFVTTAGTLTSDLSSPIGWAGSTTSAGSERLAAQRASVALPANTATTIKLQSTISATSVRANASAWRYVRRTA